jgi:hypothetical protein
MYPLSQRLQHAEVMTRFVTGKHMGRIQAPSEKRLAEFFRVEKRAHTWFETHPITAQPHVRQCLLPYNRWLEQGIIDTADVAIHPGTRRVLDALEHHIRSMPHHEQLAWWYVLVYHHMCTASGLSHIPWPYFKTAPPAVTKIIDLHVDTMGYHWTTSQKRQCVSAIRPATEMRYALHSRLFHE